MANNYIVTAQKPTAVTACVTGIEREEKKKCCEKLKEFS